MIKKPISADSHITEPPYCYVDYIDPKFRGRAPRIQRIDKIGDAFIVDGMGSPVPMGLVAAAGKDPAEITTAGVAFEDLWKSGWDAKFRVADQEKDGIAAEFIYPTVGMVICNHPDFDYKNACFDAETVGASPLRGVCYLPAGEDRLISDASGISAVVVNGTLIRRNGADVLGAEGRLPGRLLRQGAAA